MNMINKLRSGENESSRQFNLSVNQSSWTKNIHLSADVPTLTIARRAWTQNVADCQTLKFPDRAVLAAEVDVFEERQIEWIDA